VIAPDSQSDDLYCYYDSDKGRGLHHCVGAEAMVQKYEVPVEVLENISVWCREKLRYQSDEITTWVIRGFPETEDD
jgi:hypothetical protein